MIAIEISSFGPPEVLTPVNRPTPSPNENEVLVRVGAAGVARADTFQRRGNYPPPPGASDIPGLDIAGTVEAIGSNVKGFQIGDRVCAILAGGGYAEYCAVPGSQVLPIPDNWTIVEAACLPENLFTVYDNVVTRGALREGEYLLVHGGSSGIGSMAVMLGRAMKAIPIVTAGSKEKCEACLGFGAEQAINYKQVDFVAESKRLTNGRGVDVILDMVGGPYLDKNIDCIAPEGRIVIIATLGGRSGQLEIGKLMQKRGRIMGSTMRARSPEEKGEVARRLLQNVWPLLPAKDPIQPIIDMTFPLTDARLAHARMEGGDHVGKIVLTVGQ